MRNLFATVILTILVAYATFTLLQWTLYRKAYREVNNPYSATSKDYRYSLVEIFQEQGEWIKGFKIK